MRDVAEAVLPTLSTARLRLDLVQRSGAGSVVVLEEDERQLRVHLAELADDMTRARVSPTHEGIAEALAAWVAHRPVSDAAAGWSLESPPTLVHAVGWPV